MFTMLQEVLDKQNGGSISYHKDKDVIEQTYALFRIAFMVADHPEAQGHALMYKGTNTNMPCRFCCQTRRWDPSDKPPTKSSMESVGEPRTMENMKVRNHDDNTSRACVICFVRLLVLTRFANSVFYSHKRRYFL